MSLLKRYSVLAILLFFGSSLMAQSLPEGRLMRFPDIYKDKIAFMYGGDLWLVSSSGGTARRITSHPGRELFPKFSPDGRWIAFTAQYDGNFNVYVMPSEGGQPKQLTFFQGSAQPLSDRMGILNEVVTWTPDSQRIVFLSRADASNGWTKRPYSVNVNGGLPQPMPMTEGGLLSYSADGKKVAYNQIFRNFRTWKRYTGGMAQEITLYDVNNNNVEGSVPHTDWTDTFPMWHGNTIYFTSDRGTEHHLNLYSYDLGSKDVQQLTHFDEYDVMWPSLGPDAIVFENAGYLYTFDFDSKQAKKLSVQLPGDRELAMKRWVNVGKNITDFDLSPDGKRAVFGARGDVFTVPAKEGSIRNLTRSSGVREAQVAWSPDARWIAYVSDRTGEDELYLVPSDGMGAEQQMTSGYKGFKYQPVWSPDSKKLAWSDKDTRLWYVDITAKKPVRIDQSKYGEIRNYSFSPDSKWLAYDKPGGNFLSFVSLYSLSSGQITPVTTEMTNSYGPVFDPDGKYLYFLSDRDLNEVVGNIDFEFANPKTTRLYIATLRADLASPFPALSDEAEVKKAEAEPATPTPTPPTAQPPEQPETKASKKQPPTTKPGTEPKGTEAEKPAEFRIDLDGLQQRIVALPSEPAAAIRSVGAVKGAVFYSTIPIQGLNGPLPGEEATVHAYDLKERKDKTLITGVQRFAVSFDGSKLLYEAGDGPTHSYGIIEAKAGDSPKKVGDGALSLTNMRAEINPPEEWKNIYNEVWRQERDFFFEASMNGVDWQRIHDKYAALLPYVSDRYTLTYIMGEMIGELSNSHTYVGGGDYPDLHPVNVGLLGADFELDAASGRYRIKKIYPGENWNAELRSPLTEPGVNVKQGDYLIAINGRDLKAPATPYEYLVNTVNETVTLSVNSKPTTDGARNLQVKPIADEYGLHENAWIESNRKKVEAATGGRVGYVYLPDMGAPGLDAFVKQFFPQVNKQGMIFDVRYNGGGFVDQLIFARLRRVLGAMQSARNWENNPVPFPIFNGSLVCVTNHYAASDGDFFSYFFKQYKLGPLIGERTWGGVRGIRGQFPLMDGGYITRPEFGLYDLNSKWLIENHGVQPDVVIENRPDLVIKGQDPQLEKAIEMVQQDMQAHPKSYPPKPPDLPAYPSGPGM